jgi:hypothetical protein
MNGRTATASGYLCTYQLLVEPEGQPAPLGSARSVVYRMPAAMLNKTRCKYHDKSQIIDFPGEYKNPLIY